MSQRPETHFLPGSQFHVRDEWRRAARPVHRRARVRSPGRLHFNCFDFGMMQPVVPGGGGIGISTTTGITEVEITVGEGGGGAPFPTARHLLALFAEMVGYDGGDVRVEVPERIRHVHSGYGSNVTFNTALLSGLNALFGTPFSRPELWDILTRNFVENADDEYVYWGLDTGVGEACVLYGGLVWVDEHARYIGSATAHLWVVTATGDPKVLAGQRGREGFGDVEELDMLRECLEYQAEYGERLLRHLEYRMKPHLLRDDVRALLGEGWEMNRIGHHRILERFWGAEIMDRYQETARSAGALYAAMSSAGPSVLALADTEDQAKRVCDAMEAALSQTHSNFQIGRAGEKLKMEIED